MKIPEAVRWFLSKIPGWAAAAWRNKCVRYAALAVVGLVIGLVASAAFASSGTLSYTRPTTRTDGTAFAATEIASYTITCTYTPTGGVAAACIGLTPTSFGGASLGGTVTFTVTANGQACFTLRTVDTGGQSSAASNQACKAVVVAVPNPPTNVVVAFNVTINGEVVSIDPVPMFESRRSGRHENKVSGFVRAGVPCHGAKRFTYRGQDYYLVARENVGWWATVPSDNAAAPCS
jgi:hypothetical protein